MAIPSSTPGSPELSSTYSFAHSTAPATPTQSQLSRIALNSLQTPEHLHLLDEIEKLRAHHLSISLHPQLVVCGDKSSGKSSVLEAITEIPFPNACTRFVTEIVLTRGQEANLSVQIIPDSKRPEDEQAQLRKFTRSLDTESFSDLPALIGSAQKIMNVPSENGSFSMDILKITIIDPNGPEFSIIDLPGFISPEEGLQSSEKESIWEPSYEYMRDPSSIILAIVTAESDHASQTVLKRAKEADPHGTRTLGIITKPDTLSPYSSRERSILGLAGDEDIYLKLGWHVLMNGTERDEAFEDRNLQEKAFFETGAWADLPRGRLGILRLRLRLSSLMFDYIKKDVSTVYENVMDKLKNCEAQLRKMGKQRSNITEQREFLSEISVDFGNLCKAALYGAYEDSFFEDTVNLEGKLKRLRSIIQEFNTSFTKKMKEQGHLKQVLGSDEGGEGNKHKGPNKPGFPEHATRKEAILWVKTFLFNNNSHEFPGVCDSPIAWKLFLEQSKPWEALAQSHLDQTWKICRKFLHVLFQHIIPKAEVVDSVFSRLIDGQMQERYNDASSELRRLLTERRFHTIIPKDVEIREAARRRRLEDYWDISIKSSVTVGWDRVVVAVNQDELRNKLFSTISEEMNDIVYKEILEEMDNIYQISLNVFMHNIVTQVIERHVLDKLWEILSPSIVARMPESLVTDIAAESVDDQYQRKRLEIKRTSLQTSLEVCRGVLWGTKTGNIQTADKKANNYFTSFISSDDLASLLESLPTKDVLTLENPLGTKSVDAGARSGSLIVGTGAGATKTGAKSTDIGHVILSSSNTKPATNPSGAASTGIFASTATTNPSGAASTGIFASTATTNPSGAAPTGIFASTATTNPSGAASTGIFASTATTNPSGAAPTGIFASTATTNPSGAASTGIFASTATTNPSGAASTGIFASTATTNPSGAAPTGIFASTATTNPSGAASTGIFASTATTNPSGAASTGIFSTLGKTPLTTAKVELFGANPAANPTPTAFGAPHIKPAVAAKTQPTNGMFTRKPRRT